jgi:hypothetical protein
MVVLKISWEGFESLTNCLVEKIPKNGLEQILCISSGGLVLGKLLSDRLSLPLSVISAKAYSKGKTEKEKEFRIGGIASLNEIKGNILLVDDLVDSGLTMKEIYKFLKKQNDVQEIKTAAIYVKPNSIFIPDYYVEQTDRWVIFPYEKNEFRDLK